MSSISATANKGLTPGLSIRAVSTASTSFALAATVAGTRAQRRALITTFCVISPRVLSVEVLHLFFTFMSRGWIVVVPFVCLCVVPVRVHV